MKWYKNLYMSDNARASRYNRFIKIAGNKLQKDTFLITLSENENNLLDIYSSNTLLQPHFKNSKILDSIYVVGLATSNDEALLLVQDIIGDVYSKTGGFDLRTFLNI